MCGNMNIFFIFLFKKTFIHQKEVSEVYFISALLYMQYVCTRVDHCFADKSIRKNMVDGNDMEKSLHCSKLFIQLLLNC